MRLPRIYAVKGDPQPAIGLYLIEGVQVVCAATQG
jgi:hypothetical protein